MIKRFLLCFFLLSLLPVFSSLQAQVVVNGKSYTVQECLDLAAQAEGKGSYREATYFLNSVAFYVWDNRNFDQAIECFSRSIELNKKISNVSGIAGINNNLGMLYADKGDYEQSVLCFKKTLDARKNLKDKVPVVSAMINLAVVLNNLKRYDESICYLEEAIILSGEIGDKDQLKACYGLISETYEKKGDQRKSMQYFELYRTIHEMIQKDANMKAKAAVEKSRYEQELAESERKNKELELRLKNQELEATQKELGEVDSTNKELLEKASKYQLQMMVKDLEKDKLESNLKWETTLRWIAVLGLVVVLAIALILYSSNRSKKKMNRLLVLRNEQIISQAKALEEENLVRTKLLSVISHDLRSPLSSVHLMLQLLKVNTFSPEKSALYLSKLDESLHNTFALLDNLLFWAKSQLNGIHPTPEVFDFLKLVDENISLLNAGIQNKEIVVAKKVDECYVYVDKEITKLVLRNLLSNAIKFTPSGGKITVSAKVNHDTLTVAVSDTGQGIAKEQQDKIFTTRVVASNGTHNEPSSGLGLVLCKDFIEKSGGKIWFESEEGKGSTFYFTLQLSKED